MRFLRKDPLVGTPFLDNITGIGKQSAKNTSIEHLIVPFKIRDILNNFQYLTYTRSFKWGENNQHAYFSLPPTSTPILLKESNLMYA